MLNLSIITQYNSLKYNLRASKILTFHIDHLWLSSVSRPQLNSLAHWPASLFMILCHLYHHGLSVPAFCTFCSCVLRPLSTLDNVHFYRNYHSTSPHLCWSSCSRSWIWCCGYFIDYLLRISHHAVWLKYIFIVKAIASNLVEITYVLLAQSLINLKIIDCMNADD